MAQLEDRTRMVCRPSLPKIVGVLILNLLMLAACWFLITAMPWWVLPAQIAGWIGLIFFTFSLVEWRVQISRRGAVVIFGPEGIEDRRAGMALFHWNEIRRLVVVRHQNLRFLAVKVDRLEEHAQARRWVPKLVKDLTDWGPYAFGLDKTWHVIGLVGMSPGLPAVLTFLREQLGKQVDEA